MTQKQWWEDDKYNERMFDGLMFKMNIAAIIAEAHRRGKLEAWNEARALCDGWQDAIDEEIEKIQNEEEKAANRV